MLRYWRQVGGVLIVLLLSACGQEKPPADMTDIKGIMPDLSLSMTRANDGKAIGGKDYRGKIAVLYFGYTHCPDVCPTTLSNLSLALHALGNDAKNVRVLFVSVDPDRDTLPVLKSYVEAFAPQVDGLRGTKNSITDLARRYRVAFDVTPASDAQAYVVTHSNSVFFFDREGRARFVTMETGDNDRLVQTLRYLIDSSGD